MLGGLVVGVGYFALMEGYLGVHARQGALPVARRRAGQQSTGRGGLWGAR